MNKLKNTEILRLLHYLLPYKTKLIVAFILTLIALAGVTMAPYIEGLITTQLFKDVAAGSGIQYSIILTIILCLLLIYAVTNISRVVLQFLLSDSIQSSIYTMRLEIKEKITRLPIGYFDLHKTGNILSTITTDIETISNALQQSLYQVVNTLCGLAFALVMMFVIDWQMALVGALVIPLGYLAARLIIRRSQKIFRRQQNALANLNGYVQEMYSGFSEIKLFNQEENVVERFDDVNNNLRKNGFKALFTSGLLGPIVALITYVTIAVSVMMGILKVIDGVLVVGVVQAFVRYLWQENQYISQVTQLTSTIQAAFAALTRVFEFLDYPEESREMNVVLTEDNFKGEVVFDHVYFSYNDSPLIQDFSIDVKPGQTVAIVGPTGAGKTTIMNLLMRFYDVKQGAIRIDGIDIREMRRNDLRSLFGMVLQDTWLFNGTIRENLVYGKPNTTDDEVIAAAKRTKCDHFIRTMPHGYNSEINEEASNISNGEKQLLTITRALIANPKILILDEATSSVDTRLEIMIQNAMNTLMEGRTSFVIAHRLSTIKNADVILVMRNGKIVEKGNHESLLADSGFYAELYQSQFEE